MVRNSERLCRPFWVRKRLGSRGVGWEQTACAERFFLKGQSAMRARVLLSCLIGVFLGKSSPGQDLYTNPVYPHDFPDPHVIRSGDQYFAYGTQTRGTGFQLLESSDLVHWMPRKLEFPLPWATEHLWAPEVIEHGGTFYMTYSALDPVSRKHHIAIATSTVATGPFTHRTILVRGDDNQVGVIDATVFFDSDVPYLIYSEETPRRILLQRLRASLLETEGETIELLKPDLAWEQGVTEAPTVVHRRGIYHLFYSGAGYQGSKETCRYAVGHAVSKSLLGPYSKSPQPILETAVDRVYGPGHQSLIEGHNGEWWMAYHAWNSEGQPHYGQNPAGRSLRIDRLVWNGDSPTVEGPTTEERPSPIEYKTQTRAPR